MKELWKRLCLAGGLAVLIMAASTVFFKTRNPSPYENMPEGIRIANTGSSHGVHDFPWDRSGIEGTFNFANDSQSLYYDYQLVKHYCDQFEKGSILLIPVSYFSLYQSQYEPHDSFVQRNELYYELLNMDEIAQVDRERYLMKNYLPAMLFVPDKIKHVFRPAEDGQVKNPQKDQYSIEQIGKLRAEYHDKGLKREQGKIVKDQEAYESLKSLIELCQKQKITPVLVTTPFMKYYNEGWNQEFYDMFYGDIRQLTEAYSIEYLDYSHDEDFQTREDYFIDTDHLSEDGAQVFMKKVLEDLASIKG